MQCMVVRQLLARGSSWRSTPRKRTRARTHIKRRSNQRINASHRPVRSIKRGNWHVAPTSLVSTSAGQQRPTRYGPTVPHERRATKHPPRAHRAHQARTGRRAAEPSHQTQCSAQAHEERTCCVRFAPPPCWASPVRVRTTFLSLLLATLERLEVGTLLQLEPSSGCGRRPVRCARLPVCIASAADFGQADALERALAALRPGGGSAARAEGQLCA